MPGRTGWRRGRWLALAMIAAAGAASAGTDTMQDIMARDVNPGALAFWAAGNDPPDNETPAQAEKRWADAIRGAQMLQKAGPRLMAPPYARSGQWNEDAKYLVELAVEGEAAFKARNAEKAFNVGGRLYDACNECHKLYVPMKGAKIPRQGPAPLP